MKQRNDKHMPKQVDIDNLPAYWPTHFIDDNFWKELGRVIATFGFLETTLAKTIYVLSAKRERKEITDEMYKRWLARTQKSLQEPLGYLINEYEKELKEEIKLGTEISKQIDLPQLIKGLREGKKLRDVLCHSSWSPGETKDKAKPFFMNRKEEIFDTECDIAYLRQIRKATQEMICMCMNTVTLKGFEFPGVSESSEQWN